MNIWDIESNREYINYQELSLCLSTWRKDLEEMGKEGFIGYYHVKIGFFVKTYSSVKLRLLLAYLEYINPEFQYSAKIPFDKFVIISEEALNRVLSGDEDYLRKLEDATPAAFLKYGLLVAK